MALNKQLALNELDELIAHTVRDGMIVAVGGFGLSGNPFELIRSLARVGRANLTIVSNNMGVDGEGLGILLENSQVKKVVASYVGENKEFARAYLAGELEVEFTPQGTLAERLRAGGAGIPAFYTATGVGTEIADGKPTALFDGREYVLERGIVADVGLVHAFAGDVGGNLVYRRTARNFNPLCAESGVVAQRGLRVADAERDSGVNRTTLYRLFNNESSRIDFETLDKLCIYLDCEPKDVFIFEKPVAESQPSS